MAMKVVRQARLELSGGSTPDQLRPLAHWTESSENLGKMPKPTELAQTE